jgi:hypothetical protein
MSAMGHKRTSDAASAMSALPPKADIGERKWDDPGETAPKKLARSPFK